MYFSSAHFHSSISLFKYTLIFVTMFVNKFIVYFSVLEAELAVVYMESDSFLIIVYQTIFNTRNHMD